MITRRTYILYQCAHNIIVSMEILFIQKITLHLFGLTYQRRADIRLRSKKAYKVNNQVLFYSFYDMTLNYSQQIRQGEHCSVSCFMQLWLLDTQSEQTVLSDNIAYFSDGYKFRLKIV